MWEGFSFPLAPHTMRDILPPLPQPPTGVKCRWFAPVPPATALAYLSASSLPPTELSPIKPVGFNSHLCPQLQKFILSSSGGSSHLDFT